MGLCMLMRDLSPASSVSLYSTPKPCTVLLVLAGRRGKTCTQCWSHPGSWGLGSRQNRGHLLVTEGGVTEKNGGGPATLEGQAPGTAGTCSLWRVPVQLLFESQLCVVLGHQPARGVTGAGASAPCNKQEAAVVTLYLGLQIQHIEGYFFPGLGLNLGQTVAKSGAAWGFIIYLTCVAISGQKPASLKLAKN